MRSERESHNILKKKGLAVRWPFRRASVTCFQANRCLSFMTLFPSVSCLFFLLLLSSCGSIRPDRDTGRIIDASRNLSVALYYPVTRPDSPFPGQRLAFIRHFHYISRRSPWTLLASGDARPTTPFEQLAVYIIRFNLEGSFQLLRILELPAALTGGVMASRAHLAIAAPSLVTLDGQSLIRNTSGAAIAYQEDGPLYGGFSLAISDSSVEAEQPPQLLADTRVRTAALSFDGSVAAYVDASAILYTIGNTPGALPEKIADLSVTLGPLSVTGLQWEPGSPNKIYLRIERGFSTEVWAMDLQNRSLDVDPRNPATVLEPGSDLLPVVDELTNGLSAGGWQVPAPDGFQR